VKYAKKYFVMNASKIFLIVIYVLKIYVKIALQNAFVGKIIVIYAL
jgi:hypothetical protein